MDPELELRKLPPGPLYQLVQILEASNSWKQLMATVPKDLSAPSILKYKMEHIKLIESAGKSQQRPCAEIFLDEWGTSGRERPNLEQLLRLLVDAELFRAAEFVAADLLKGPVPQRPTTGPSACVDLSEQTIDLLVPRLNDLEPRNGVLPRNGVESRNGLRLDEANEQWEANERREANEQRVANEQRDDEVLAGLPDALDSFLSDPAPASPGGGRAMREEEGEREGEGDTEERWIQQQETQLIAQLHVPVPSAAPAGPAPPLATQLPHHSYASLRRHTDDFCDGPLADRGAGGGRRLGTGAFGSVYLAVLPGVGEVAVKRLNADAINVEKQFRNEVETLSKFRHPHLLPLLGYCCDGPSYCLVYEYMSNGSLQERLANKPRGTVVPWRVRVSIGLGTSRGILHLHTAFDKPLIHRDIKTANILLDQHLVPKLGDFGLVRLGANGSRTQSVAMTTTVFGTSAYMAPEAFRGDISVKIDTFSFGVVILELLTSLPPYDENREGCDLVTHVEEQCEGSIRPLLDLAAGDWGDSDVSTALYATALDCLEEKRRRPGMAEVVARLKHIADVMA